MGEMGEHENFINFLAFHNLVYLRKIELFWAWLWKQRGKRGKKCGDLCVYSLGRLGCVQATRVQSFEIKLTLNPFTIIAVTIIIEVLRLLLLFLLLLLR